MPVAPDHDEHEARPSRSTVAVPSVRMTFVMAIPYFPVIGIVVVAEQQDLRRLAFRSCCSEASTRPRRKSRGLYSIP